MRAFELCASWDAGLCSVSAFVSERGFSKDYRESIAVRSAGLAKEYERFPKHGRQTGTSKPMVRALPVPLNLLLCDSKLLGP